MTIHEPLSAFEKLAGPLSGEDAMIDVITDVATRQVAVDVENFLAGRPPTVLELEFDDDPLDDLTLDEWLAMTELPDR